MNASRLFFEYSSVLFFTALMTLAGASWLQQQRSPQPSVSMRLSNFLDAAAPPAAPTVYAVESELGPRTLLDRWNPVVREAAAKFNIPAMWLRAVMRNETGGRTVLAGDKPIVSHAGAQGIMQLMPGTYDEMADKHGLGEDPFNARDNVYAAAAYLRWLKDRYGFPGMFAAYNFGPGNWEQHLRRKRALPSETRNYLKQITAYLKTSPSNLVHAVHLTGPDGKAVAIDTKTISAIMPARANEYAPGTQTIVWTGKKRQAVREDVAMVVKRLSVQGVAL
jgi:soluble lytic murein transglycosylase-like protein